MMICRVRISPWIGVSLGFLGLSTYPLSAVPADAVELFESRVRPVLVEKCFRCHGEEKQRSGLRLDSLEALLEGGDSGPAIVPADDGKSLILEALRQEGDLRMPPKEKLPDEAIEAIATWIRSGAPWPKTSPSNVPAKPTSSESIEAARRDHWAFRVIDDPPLPPVRDESWVSTSIDRFVLSRLERAGLKPRPVADPRTLIRRVTYDLTGLPPTPQEVESFGSDPSPAAWSRVIDRLLSSPRYGERWGRHWLDVARYADTKGYVFQEERRFPYSYTYRDWVIRAFNEDLPYDRFLREQIAADLLPNEDNPRSLAAMGFLTLGRRFLNNPHDIIDDRIDVVTRGTMALTVACARCHDHKYDPIPTADYYSLYGIFASSVEPTDLPLLGKPEPTPESIAFEKELGSREAAVQAFLEEKRGALATDARERAHEYLVEAMSGVPMSVAEEARKTVSLPDGELNPGVTRQWRALLDATRDSRDAILAPWHAFAALPQEEFASRAAEVAQVVAGGGSPERPVHPLVARAFEKDPPTDLGQVAERYRDVLRSAYDESIPHGADSAKELRDYFARDGAPGKVPIGEVEGFLNRAARNRLAELRQNVDVWRATGAGAPPRAMSLVDASVPKDPVIFVRGNPGRTGDPVARQFLAVLAPNRKPYQDGSGRRELAEAIASPENPLTARVIVNRVWLHHFGDGLVRTPSDFGARSEPPTHPELLDHLASRLIAGGWSIKNLHRLILLSSTYRQSWGYDEETSGQDPENRLLGRGNRRRLDFEALRDSILFVAGRLDLSMGGPSIDLLSQPFPTRRTVYGFIDRQNLPGLFRTFDFASPDATNAKRHTTTVPQQALFLMNSPFVIEQARHLVERPELTAAAGSEDRVRVLYRLVLAREPDEEERALATRFLEKELATGEGNLSRLERYAQVLLLSNEFCFLD